MSDTNLPVVRFDGSSIPADFRFDAGAETFWLTQKQIAELFDISIPAVNQHLGHVFDEGELDREAVIKFFHITAEDGKLYNVLHYNVDAILSVGYRVNSKKATAFRQWATATLKSVILKGYAIDEARLRRDKDALAALVNQVRAIRTDEKNVYKAVRDCFALGSSDYNPDHPESRRFFARLQDRFTFAATGQVSAEILLSRADHTKADVGLVTKKGKAPTKEDVRKAKNFLVPEELRVLHRICDQFMLLLEDLVSQGRRPSMADFSERFDLILVASGRKPLKGYKGALADKAERHALRELALFREEALASGQVLDKRLH